MMNRHCTFAAALIVLLSCVPLFAQPLPQARLYAVYPPGAQAGQSIDLAITSAADNDDIRQLIFSHPGITAQPKTDDMGGLLKTPRFIDNQFTVKVEGNVPPGVYEVRIAGAFGISNARAFVVSDLPQSNDPGNNNDPDKAAPLAVDSIVCGVANARAVDYYKLTLKKGQRVLIDCQAERIDSRMNAVLTLINPQGRQMVRQRSGNGRDPLIDFTPDADGDYTIAVQDLIYAGGDQYFYRLTIRTRPYIDYVFPPAGLPGQKSKFTLLGRNLPGGSATDLKAFDGTSLQSLEVEIDVPADARAAENAIDNLVGPAEAAMDAFLYQFKGSNGTSNPIRIGVARAPVVIETEPNDDPAKATKVSLPCEVAGRFSPRGDRDIFEFEAKKGDILWIELFSHRLGLPVDPAMVIQQVKKDDKGVEQVKDIAAVDETPGVGDARFSTATDDPSYRLVVPEDGTYRVMVRDLFQSGPPDTRRVYRLAIQPESNDGAIAHGVTPDFRLLTLPSGVLPDKNNKANYDTGSTVLRRGGSDEIILMAARRGGFQGDIEINVEGLPQGVTMNPLMIPQGTDSATLVLHAAADAPWWAGELKIIGKAKINDKDVTRQARASQIVWGPEQNKSRGWSRLGASICASVTDAEKLPYTVTFGEVKVYESEKNKKFKIPVKVERRDGFKAVIKISLVNTPNNALVIGKGVADIAGDKNEGEIEIEVKANAKPDGYVLQFNADAQISYARNPKAVEEAGAMKKELDELNKAIVEEAKKADEAFKAADKAAKDAAEELKKTQAEQRDAVAKKVEDANKARTEAEAANKAAADRVKKIADAIKAMDAQQKKVTDAAKPKNLNVTMPIGTVVVKVVEPPPAPKKEEAKK